MSKIGRNAPCPCGSGKKYKKCCLLNQDGRPKSVPPIKYRAVYTELDQLSNSVVDLINKISWTRPKPSPEDYCPSIPIRSMVLIASLWCMRPGETEKRLRNITAKQRILRDQIPALKRKALTDSYPKLNGWNQIIKNVGYPSHFRPTVEMNNPWEEKGIRTKFKEYVFGILSFSAE